ncbi:extracellular solute-binding protein [Paenibacillus sp. FSL R10-2734]|uniref:ABC transporter substrate-binding protein n=1 Tax=Paenibacillus sp. FSL R10-2734 TaxID=2954691 RepID=UPI0030D6FC24
MVRKVMTKVLTSVMLLSVLAACGGTKEVDDSQTSQSNAPNATETASSTNPEDIKADLNWFGLAQPKEFEDRYGQYIKKKFPNVNITYINQTEERKMEQVIASGTDIDIYLATAGELREDWIPANLAQDLTPLISSHNIPLDTIEPAYMDAVTIDGKTYLLPLSDNKFVMYYNKSIFDRFGVEYPHDGMTWDEAIDLGKKITRNEDGKQYLGLWLSPKHYLRVTQNSAGFVDPATNKATVNNDQWKFIYDNIFYKLSRDPGVQQRASEKFYGHDDFNKEFLVGMYVFTSGWMNSANSSLAMDWDIASVPEFKEYPGLNTQPYATYVGITSTSKHQEVAAEIAKYLVSEEYQTIMSKRGYITPLTTQAVRDVAFADYEFAKTKNIQALYHGKPAPQRTMTEYDEIVLEQAMYTGGVIPEIVKGKMDVNTALRQAEENGNKLIQEQIAQQ